MPVELLLHCYNEGKTYDGDFVTLEQALALLEIQQNADIEPDNYIGFSLFENPDALIQFCRISSTEWLVDIPKMSNDEFEGAFQITTTHTNVKEMTSQFFDKESSIYEYIRLQKYDKLILECKKTWDLDFELLED